MQTMSVCPLPRIAHSFVLDVANDQFYLFGGCPATNGKMNHSMRLDDCWTFKVLDDTFPVQFMTCFNLIRSYW